jgi:uncharacterized protein
MSRRGLLTISKFALLQLLRAYKFVFSPMFPPACRYVPTCSEYAIEAVERYGALRGGLKVVWRLLRCHPFVQGGYDPVAKTDILLNHQPEHFCARPHASSKRKLIGPKNFGRI